MSQCGCGSRVRACLASWSFVFLLLRDVTCCMVGMRKSLRIQGLSDVEEHSGAFWFPAFLRCALLGNQRARPLLAHRELL